MTEGLSVHTFEARSDRSSAALSGGYRVVARPSLDSAQRPVNEESMVIVTLLVLSITAADSEHAPGPIPRLEEALARFEKAGLALPESLQIRLDHSDCERSTATARPPWTVTYCLRTIHDTYWEHELAHIWVECHLTDEDRQDFTAEWNLPTWYADGEAPWQWHGTERAAVAIERYVSGYSVIGESWPWMEYAHWLLDRAGRNSSYRGGDAACSQPDGHADLPSRWPPAEVVTASAGHRVRGPRPLCL